MKKRFYSIEFQRNTVELSYQRTNIKELATELGIDVQRIYKWRKASNETKSLSPKKSKEDLVSIFEFKKLQKSLKDKELELEILKKDILIFS